MNLFCANDTDLDTSNLARIGEKCEIRSLLSLGEPKYYSYDFSAWLQQKTKQNRNKSA